MKIGTLLTAAIVSLSAVGGGLAAYVAVAIIEGEPHLVRDDFRAPAPRPGTGPEAGRPLLTLVHVTDLQLADVQSPTRFEFLNARFADPRYAEIIPVQRPQEALTAHAVDATLRTLGSVHGPGWKPAWRRCTRPIAARTATRSRPGMTTGW